VGNYEGGAVAYTARFVVDDSAAAFGVLRVVYADCWTP
jgi:hypothetical protein